MRSARTVTLIEVVALEGEGTTDSIAREVTYYFTPEGELVATRDHHQQLLDQVNAIHRGLASSSA